MFNLSRPYCLLLIPALALGLAFTQAVPSMALAQQAQATSPAEASAQDLLVKADVYRLPNLNSALNVALVSTKNGEQVSQASYKVWTQGTAASRVEMLDPKVRGQRVLMTDDGMWLFIPSTRRAVRITPMQRLLGEASYGDIGRMVWREDYTAAFADGADGQPHDLNGASARVLSLTARKDSAVYTHIDLTVEDKTGRPLAAKFYLASGKLFKQADFAAPTLQKDQPIITQITFVDTGAEDQKTVMTLSDITPSDLPSSAFTQTGITQN